MKAYKIKRCKACGNTFQPTKGFQRACSPSCAFNYARVERIRKEKQKAAKELREGRARTKTRAKWLSEAQTEVNRYVRLRDAKANLPCISCQRHHQGQYHAGHFRSVASAPECRFMADENIFRQCSACNNHLSGNLIEYRKNLLVMIGAERLEALEGKHPPLKLQIDDIKIIKDKYRLKANELAKELDSYTR